MPSTTPAVGNSSDATDVLVPVLPAFEALGNLPRQQFFRPTQPLTYELANHSRAYLEGRKYADGFHFLNSLLSSGTSISRHAKPYIAYLAPADQLALASTLIVYPGTTTRTASTDTQKGSDAALRYLRSVHTTISPLQESIRSAYVFPDDRSRRHHRSLAGSPSADDEVDFEKLSGLVANSQALWNRASDFWHIVGWAFNCSVLHKKRWERWKLWLQLMLDFLETEWAICSKESKHEFANREDVLTRSLLWRYISSEDPTNRSSRRRMVRAIFSMADARSMAEFKEVWQDETAGPKVKEGEDTELAKIDIENGDFGDYQDDEDIIMEVGPDVSLKSNRRAARKISTSADSGVSPFKVDEDTYMLRDSDAALDRLGGLDALQLRQRLVALLVKVAQALPSHFTPISDLFDSLTEELIRLPTMIFGVVLSFSTLPSLEQMGLNANLLLPLVSGRLPDFTVLSPEQSHLEDMLLPLRATTESFAANAKISLILEQIVMCTMDSQSLKATDGVRHAVEAGIKTRRSVYGTARGKKVNAAEEEQGEKILQESSARLRCLLEALEVDQGITSQPRRTARPIMPINISISTASSLSSLSETSMDEE